VVAKAALLLLQQYRAWCSARRMFHPITSAREPKANAGKVNVENWHGPGPIDGAETDVEL
jgi:hypothetical protein